MTMCVSLISTLTGIPVRKDVAMTGEITLRGKVLPVGGIREKVMAAHRAGTVQNQSARRGTDGLREAERFSRHLFAVEIRIVLVTAGRFLVSELKCLLE